MKKLFLLLPVLFLLVVGCSRGGVNPLSPSDEISIDNIPIIEATAYEDSSFQAIGLMGAYELKIDPDNLTADLVSKRASSLGESWIVSGILFFTVTPCSDCLSIKSLELTTDNYLQMHFSISHPFPPGDPSKPPTAINRLDLDIFDLALVLHPLDSTPASFPLTDSSAYTGIIAKNAGYTRDLASLVEDDAALPYVLVVDDNSSSMDTFNKFAMGTQDLPFNVFFDLAYMTAFSFDMYLTMGYGASAQGRKNRLNPTYFNPEFNRKSAWKINVIPPQGNDPPSVDNTWKDNDSTTLRNITVEVFDWQQGSTNIANPPVNPDDIAFPSNVVQVSVEIPGMTDTLATASSCSGGLGTPSSPLIYILPVANENLLSEGEYFGLARVTDERIPQPIYPYGTIDYMIDVPFEGTFINYTIPEFTTYQIFIATVVGGNQPPTCDLHLSKNSGDMNEIIQADPGTSFDPEGLLLSYEYDFDYDGINFETDAIQVRTDADFGDPIDIALGCNTTGSPVVDTIAIRVCDSGSPPICLICTDDVQVSTKLGGNIGNLQIVSINRGEAAADPELITSIDLDWDDFPCAVEYSIEQSDGFAPTTWISIGISTTSNFNYVLSETNGDYDQDYRFRVVAHTIPGGSLGNDSAPSEEVFVLFVSGGGYFTGNLWAQHREMAAWFFPSAYIYPGIDGWGYAMLSFVFVANTGAVNCWSIYRSPAIPDIVGQSEAFCDGYVDSPGANPGNPLTTTAGLCIGTLSAIPSSFTPSVFDFEPANTIYDASYYAYNYTNVMGLNSEFGETNQSGWGDLYPWPRHVGYYLNGLLDDGPRDYIALGAANGDTVIHSTTIYWQTDAWTFVVQ